MTNNDTTLPLSGTQFLYAKPEALNADVHAQLRYRADESPFAKAEGVHLVPLLVGDFPKAMMHYPIIFAGEERTPLAVLGLREGENYFVKDGKFEHGAYVPAYLRRHPFTLADAGEEQFVVCIDRDVAGFVSEGEGQALFESGEPTEFTKNAMAFLTEFEAERVRNQAFIEVLKECDLFEVKNTIFVANGQQEPIAEYFAVSESRIAELKDDQLVRLVKSGAMTAIDAHLLSLQRWDALLDRRAPAPAAPAEQPVEEHEPA